MVISIGPPNFVDRLERGFK